MRRALRRALFASALFVMGALLLVVAAPAGAAQGSLPPGDGTLRGRILRDPGGEPAAGVDVVLYTAGADGSVGLAGVVSDAEGRFAFEAIASDPTRVYLVGARSGEVPLGERTRFAPGTHELEVELRMAEPSADSGAVRVDSVFLRIDRGCERLRVNEAHAVSNPTAQVIYVPEDQRAGSVPVLEALLPAGAADFSTPFGDTGLGYELEGQRLRFWGPVYPGGQDIEFGYSLPGVQKSGAGVQKSDARKGDESETLSFERGFPAGSGRVLLLSDAAGPEIRGARLSPAEGREVEGRPYRAVAADAVEPGGGLAFEVELPAPGPPAVVLERSELWLELDDAALSVDENHMLRIEAEGPLRPASDLPLLCLPIPAGAEALRFSNDTLRMGVEQDASGALAFRGPLPEGESVISLRYRLPVGNADGGTRFARRFPAELELLSIFVADTGVLAETSRLHRQRSVRRGERNYLHLEGFQIGRDEEVVLDLSRLASPRALPRMVSIGFALLFGAAALAYLIAPLGGRRSEAASAQTAGSELAAEREAVYASIRDLEEDFDTGKLTPEDHADLRAELRARAVQLLQRERALEAKAPQETVRPASAGFCSGCGERLAVEARFCSHCGEKVVGAAG